MGYRLTDEQRKRRVFCAARTEGEVADLENAAIEAEHAGSRWPGMTYEQGIAATLRWLQGEDDHNPMAD